MACTFIPALARTKLPTNCKHRQTCTYSEIRWHQFLPAQQRVWVFVGRHVARPLRTTQEGMQMKAQTGGVLVHRCTRWAGKGCQGQIHMLGNGHDGESELTNRSASTHAHARHSLAAPKNSMQIHVRLNKSTNSLHRQLEEQHCIPRLKFMPQAVYHMHHTARPVGTRAGCSLYKTCKNDSHTTVKPAKVSKSQMKDLTSCSDTVATKMNISAGPAF